MNVFGKGGSPALDYSGIDSLEKAWRSVEQGDLVAILMLPEMFGGTERDENIIFVPPATADRKDKIDEEVILPLVKAGKAVHVTPHYAGRALVPVALNIAATSPEPHFFSLQIWKASLPDPG